MDGIAELEPEKAKRMARINEQLFPCLPAPIHPNDEKKKKKD